MDIKISCTGCRKPACIAQKQIDPPEECPARTRPDILQAAAESYNDDGVCLFAENADLLHDEAVLELPEGGRVPRNPRVEETVLFAKKMRYRSIGIAFCSALRREARTAAEIFENRGFDVVSVCCTVQPPAAAVPKFKCNPIAQALLLNDAQVDFNVVIGLCVGHDSLFFRFADAPATVLVAKDRVFGNNPVSALHEAKGFYRWLLRKELPGNE